MNQYRALEWLYRILTQGLNLASNYWKAWLKESLEQTFLDRKLTVKKKKIKESESNGMKPETKMGTYI